MQSPPTILNLLTGCEQGGIWPGCHSNCSGSSQTLGNPPVTLADLSPPQPEDNRSGGSGGPDSFQPSRSARCPPPPPRRLPGPVPLAPSPASIPPGPRNLHRPSTSLPQTSLTYSSCSASFTMHLTIRKWGFFVFMHLFFFIFPLLRGRANIFYLFTVVSLCVKNSVVHGAPPKCGMNEFDGHTMSFFFFF